LYDNQAKAESEPKKPLFLLWAEANTAVQKVYLHLVNRSSSTLTTFVVDTQWTSQDGVVERHKFMFKYVDSGSEDAEDAPWTGYYIPAKATVRAVTVCQVGKAYADDCEAYVGVLQKGEVPLSLRFAE